MTDIGWEELRKLVDHGSSIPSGLAGRMMDEIERLQRIEKSYIALHAISGEQQSRIARLEKVLEAILTQPGNARDCRVMAAEALACEKCGRVGCVCEAIAAAEVDK